MIYERILDALEFLREQKNITPEVLRSDRKLLGSILWYLYMAVQGSIDLGLKVISKLKLRVPESYADVFLVLKDGEGHSGGSCGRTCKDGKFRYMH